MTEFLQGIRKTVFSACDNLRRFRPDCSALPTKGQLLEPKSPSAESRFGSWRQIGNEELTLSDIPSRGASWEQIKRFAGSFVAYNTPEAEQYNRLWGESRRDFLAGRKMALAGFSLSELRAVLFLDWRALRHGTTWQSLFGNVGGAGIVFKLIPSSSGTWSETVLFNFVNGGGGNPYSGVILHSGIAYGTTYFGGNGNGVAYKLQT